MNYTKNNEQKDKNTSYASLHSFLHEKMKLSEMKKQVVQCSICGRKESEVSFHKMSAVCSRCRRSRVTTRKQASNLLYLSYRGFNDLFPIDFCYPNLEIKEINCEKKYSNRIDCYTDLVQITEARQDGFSLCIVKNIPFCFMDELYSYAFAKEFLNGILEKKKAEKKTKMDIKVEPVMNKERGFGKERQTAKEQEEPEAEGPSATNEDSKAVESIRDDEYTYSDSQELLEIFKSETIEELEKMRGSYQARIMICYLYDAGRKEQAELLKKALEEPGRNEK